MKLTDITAASFVPFDELLRLHAVERGDAIALVDENHSISWQKLDALIDRTAAALQRDGVCKNDTVAIASANSVNATVAFLGTVRAGAVPVPLSSSATAVVMLMMLVDSGSHKFFVDDGVSAQISRMSLPDNVMCIALDDLATGVPFEAWVASPKAKPKIHDVSPGDPFNIIYSSGTTGSPKGIIQSHQMRHEYLRRMLVGGLDDSSVAIASTPLYSNTTLVALLPTLAAGGKVVLMKKFDATKFLELSERERVTSAMLVPAQYRRLMEHPYFDNYDLSSYRIKRSTSAPFPAWLKADVLKRWPGALVESYGLTEGGASTTLFAHDFPHKLHTVGQVTAGHVIKIIDGNGKELPAGETGEIVGRSQAMMSGYLGQLEKSRDIEWFDTEGNRYIRHGDIGRFDEDGFLILLDRAKDLIISGGFNIYPSDLEAELMRNRKVREAAVFGVPSDRWGETPLGVVVLADPDANLGEILADANSRLGKTQRIASIKVVDELPRSTIGKVLKRELRDRFAVPAVQATKGFSPLR